jgi:hypothetical protein
MKYRRFVGFGILFVTAAIVAAQANANAAWVGVWRGERDGQPSVTLTLAEDTGELGGTVVLGVFNNDDGNARLIASEPHVLIHPHPEGKVLSFQVKRIGTSNELLNFVVASGSDGKAQLHCLNCGPSGDGPTVELVRAQ